MDLKQISTLNDAAVAVFEEFKGRQRYRSETNIRRLRRTLQEKFGKIDYGQLIDTFKAMETQGLGSLVIGRGDKPTRFMWKYSLREVAKAAETGKAPQKALPVRQITTPVKTPNPTKISLPRTDQMNIYVMENGQLHQIRVTGQDNIEALRSVLEGLKK